MDSCMALCTMISLNAFTVVAGKVAAARRKEAEKAAAAKAAALQRRQRALRKLGLVPPRGSQYAEEPCLDIARTWFAQVRRHSSTLGN